jgi:hypothetical protein
MARGFSARRPGNWRELIADLTLFYRWPPSAGFEMTITRLLWWVEQANRQVKERANAK